MYPSTDSHPNGKLRLLGRMQPHRIHREQASGLAFSEEGRILDLQPEAIHQRVTFTPAPTTWHRESKGIFKLFNNI